METQQPQPIVKDIAEYRFSSADLLGSGSSSKVYKGTNTKTGGHVAIKVIELKKIKSSLEEKLLSNEIKAVKTITHPNVISIAEVYQSANNVYFVSEFCEGDLTSVIKGCDGPMSEEQVVKFLGMMLDGVEALHRKAIIHRDIKPANFLVKDGVLKVADLGFCDFLCERRIPENYGVGSPLYMSPQAYRKNMYSFKSDVWACGISIYEMILGCQPFKGMSYDAIIRQISQLVFFQSIKTSPFLKTLLQGMLKLDLESRLTLAECKSMLQKHLNGQPITLVQRPVSRRCNVSSRPQSPAMMSNRPLSSHRSSSNSSARSIRVVVSRLPSPHIAMPVVYTPFLNKQNFGHLESNIPSYVHSNPRKAILHNLFPKCAPNGGLEHSPMEQIQKQYKKQEAKEQTNQQLILRLTEDFIGILKELSKSPQFTSLKTMVNQQCKLFINKLLHIHKVNNLGKTEVKTLIHQYHSVVSQMALSPSKDNTPKTFYHREVIQSYKSELERSIREVESPESTLYRLLNRHLMMVNLFIQKRSIKNIEQFMLSQNKQNRI